MRDWLKEKVEEADFTLALMKIQDGKTPQWAAANVEFTDALQHWLPRKMTGLHLPFISRRLRPMREPWISTRTEETILINEVQLPYPWQKH